MVDVSHCPEVYPLRHFPGTQKFEDLPIAGPIVVGSICDWQNTLPCGLVLKIHVLLQVSNYGSDDECTVSRSLIVHRWIDQSFSNKGSQRIWKRCHEIDGLEIGLHILSIVRTIWVQPIYASCWKIGLNENINACVFEHFHCLCMWFGRVDLVHENGVHTQFFEQCNIVTESRKFFVCDGVVWLSAKGIVLTHYAAYDEPEERSVKVAICCKTSALRVCGLAISNVHG